MTKIAFIGLGNMGGPMAANLAKAGHEVRAFDLSADARKKAVEAGCIDAPSLKEAIGGAEAVVSMLPASKHVRAVYEGEGGVFELAGDNAFFIDCSTIDVPAARAVGEAASKAGYAMVDAPVSGGVAAAEGGTLTFMVGGPKEGFDRAKPILDVMGKAVIHAGEAGTGQVAKICNNMLLGISMIGTCEAFALAKKLGMDPQRFFEISSQASGQCWSMTSYCPEPGPVPAAPSNRDYKPGFAVAMMLKDLKLAQEAAAGAGASTPMGAQAEALYAMLDGLGAGDRDFSGVMKMIDGGLGETGWLKD